MSASIFHIEKKDGQMSDIDKAVFKKEWDALEDGKYTVGFEQKKTNATRYKYYFDCILAFALPSAAKYYLLIEKGKQRPVRNTAELHYIMKVLFNPVTIINEATGEAITETASTTTMSDKDFIAEFQEKVIEHFAGDPFNVEFMDYQEWGKLYGEGNWHRIKHMATTQDF